MKLTLSNLKNTRAITKLLLFSCSLFFSISAYSQSQIGDPGVSLDNSRYDSKYPIMKTFVQAGVQGGIPLRNSLTVKNTLNPGGNIQSGIDAVAKQGGGVLLLKNGKYTISSGVKFKSNVVVRGESKASVIIEVTMRAGGTRNKKDAFTFGSITKAGLEDVTMKFIAPGAEPQDDANNSTGGWCRNCWENDPNGKKDLYVRFVKMDRGAKNCWIDNCNFFESGTDPLYLAGQYLTCRNNLVDRAYNKGSGGNGYYDVRCDNSLFVNETVKRIRHFAIQQGGKENVVINCKFEVDVNYHSGDDGDNLVENCEITIPKWRGWNTFATGGAQYGHKKPGPNNIIFNNQTDFKGKKGAFAGNKTVYTYTGYGRPSVLSNTPPTGGTFYPVKFGKSIPTSPTTPTTVAVSGVIISITTLDLNVNETSSLSATVSPSNATNKSIAWSSSNPDVVSVNSNGLITAKKTGIANITVTTINGNKTGTAKITVTAPVVVTPTIPIITPTPAPINIAPVVSIMKPNNNQIFKVGETIAVDVTATDDKGVTSVELFLNGKSIRQEKSAPYNWAHTSTLDPELKNMTAGTYTIKVVATDTNEATTEKSISVKVEAPTPTPTPPVVVIPPVVTPTPAPNNGSIAVTISKPNNNQVFKVGETVAVDVTTNNNNSIAKVELYLDEKLVRHEKFAPYNWGHLSTLDPELKNMKAGVHSIKAVVTDINGAISKTSISINVENMDQAETSATLSFANPSTNQTFNVGETVLVDVKSSISVKNVRLYLNDKFIRQENVSPYLWGKNDTALKNLKAGTYILKAIATNTNGSISETQTSITIGPKEAKSINNNPYITLYPNPTSVNTSTTIDGAIVGTTISVYNGLGQVVKQVIATSITQEIILDGLPSGLYFINSNNEAVLKLIIK